jgi:urease accessory protein
VLLVHAINQTAGLFGGDEMNVHVKVEPGASVLLSSPSAARFHPSRGREITLDQRFDVQAGARLDVYPEISIPQRDSCALQRTQFDVEPGGELLYLETVAPGRVASGEAFAFSRFAWRTDVRLAGRLIHRERTALTPGDVSMAGLRSFSPADYYGGLLVISPVSEKWEMDFAHEAGGLSREGLAVGATRLTAGGWSMRVLAADALRLRSAIARLRELVYAGLRRPLPDARRY